jgi:hypothetical protein
LSKVRNRLGLSDGLKRRRTAENVESSTELNQNFNEGDTETPQSPRSLTAPNPPVPPTRSTWVSPLTKYLPSPLGSWWNRLRQEHVNAREQQAAENEQKRFDVYGYIDETGQNGVVGVPGNGWGLGSFALTSRRASEQPAAPEDERVVGDEESGFEMRNMGDRSPWGDDDERSVPQRPRSRLRPASRHELSRPSSSWSWMGPFRRWRLKDATVY